jgi:hypothetical protein
MKKGTLPNQWVCDYCNRVFRDIEPFNSCEREHSICTNCTVKTKTKLTGKDEYNVTKENCPVCRRDNEKNN